MRVRPGLFVGLLVLAWAVSAQAGPPDANMEAFGVQQPRVIKSAPNFTLTDLDGARKSLSDMRGKVVLLTFWATWCAPCRHEMSQIEALWEQYRNHGFTVLAVNVDRGNISGIRDFIRQRNLSFPSVLDPDGTVRNTYGVRALPTTYLIGRDGKIIGRIIGERDWSGDSSAQLIRTLLHE